MDSGAMFIILLILFLLWFVFRRFLSLQGVKQITTADLKSELKNKDIQFIDVRTPYEFRTKHIKGFKNFPLTNLPRLTNQLSKDKEVFVICQRHFCNSPGLYCLYSILFLFLFLFPFQLFFS